MRGDVIGLVAFDFILRIIFRRVMRMPLVVEIGVMNLDDLAADPASFGIPADVITNRKFAHIVLHCFENVSVKSMFLERPSGPLCVASRAPTSRTLSMTRRRDRPCGTGL